MPFQTIRVENPDSLSLVLGRAGHHQTVDRIHKTIVAKDPGIRFGVAAREASDGEIIRKGTDKGLIGLASSSLNVLGVADTFVLFTENGILPRSLVQTIKVVSSIKVIYCATSSPVEVIVRVDESGRDVMGLVDEYASSDEGSITQKTIEPVHRGLLQWLPLWVKRMFLPFSRKRNVLPN